MAWNMDDYEPVSSRIDRFYAKYPAGRILTEIVGRGDNDWVVKALVYRREKDTEPSATGFAQEIVGSNPVNRTSALENCETSAIGRALANLGFDAKGQRASREEMEKVQRQNSAGQSASQPRSATSPADAPPKNAGGGADGADNSPKQAAASPAPSPTQSQSQEGGTENKGSVGSAKPSPVPPVSADWTSVLEEYGASGVLQIAQEVAKELELKPPFTRRALAEMPSEVFERVIARLGEQERVA